MRSRSLLAGVAGLLVVATAVGDAQNAKRVTAGTIVAVEKWAEAVRSHSPGAVDDPVVSIASLSCAARTELNAGIGLFLSGLTGRTVATDLSNRAEQAVVTLGREAASPDADTFLIRAAMLHTDVARYSDRLPMRASDERESLASLPSPSPDGPTCSAVRQGVHTLVPPLLTGNRIVLTQDGRVVGETAASWNWPFARSLLDVVDAHAAASSFVRAWYHATAAYMFANGLFGDVGVHLRHAAEVLPDDGRVLFDRGCYAELLGLPMHQALLGDKPVVERRPWTPGFRSTRPVPVLNTTPALNIPPAEATNAEAERLFRRALTVDPSLVEARVRVGRLLDVRGQHRQTLAELDVALAGEPRGAVAFYAHMFAGRAAQRMGEVDSASRHYQAALALFPGAQSARLAGSQLALLRADVPGALTAIDRLGAGDDALEADPWWQYYLCAGRHQGHLVETLWTDVGHDHAIP